MKNTILTTLATLAVLLSVSCDPKEIVSITDIEITTTPAPLSLVVGGEPGQIDIRISPANATNRTVIISVAPEGVVTVDDDGIVTPVGPGTATITATALLGNATETCTVTVQEPESIIHTYTGTFSVAPGTDNEADIENATVEFVIAPDGATALMNMLQVSFAPGRMPGMDITVPDITMNVALRDSFTFSGEGVIPTIAIGGVATPVDRYTITGFEGEGSAERLSWRMMCGEYPLTFTGTRTVE